ncbi:MAG: hydrogen gas-evolving membrane-bound hydrogenase subunit E, partial [Candidatus Fimadaptatus sp.]
MAKIRSDYENSWWPRFLRWLKNGSDALDRDMQEELASSGAEHHTALNTDAAAMESRHDARVMEGLQNDQRAYERLHTWRRNKGAKVVRRLYMLLSVVVCLNIIWVLLETASYLPPFGSPDNPVNNEVSQRYIEKGMEETGAVNIVAGMILDYRAFDTLGESNVLFVAACSVLILLRISSEKNDRSA